MTADLYVRIARYEAIQSVGGGHGGGSYRKCLVCGRSDYMRPGNLEHAEGCEMIGYVEDPEATAALILARRPPKRGV